MATTVRNIRDRTYDVNNPDHVYIGRENRTYGLAGSEFANPFAMGREADRGRVIGEYRAYLQRRPGLLAALGTLRGKTLYCWCAPLPCHGHVLAKLADALPAELGALAPRPTTGR